MTIVYDPDEFKYAMVFEMSLPIVHWSPDLVVARNETPDDVVSLTINVRARDVVWTQTGRPALPVASGTDSPDMSLRLVDGFSLSPVAPTFKSRIAGDSVFAEAARYVALRKKNMVRE